MMKPTGLLVSTGVLLVLSGTVWYFNKHPKAPEPLPESPKVLTLHEDQIEGLRIAKPGAEPVVLKNLAGSWTIAEPKAMPADQDAVKSLVTTSAALTADRLIDEHPANLTDFGLTNPALEVDVTAKGGAQYKVQFGSDNPSGSYAYAKLENKPAVYLVPSATKTTFDKTVNDLRDKRLLPFNQDKLTAVSVTSKGPTFEFGKNGQSEWQIVKPKPMRADSSQVDDLVRKLSDAKMDLTDDNAPAEFAKADKVASASVTDNSGTQTIDIRQAKDKTYYAKSTAVEGVYKLTGDLGDAVKDKDVDSFRNKKLFDFGFNDPTKIEINGTAYQKTGQKWNGPSGEIDSNSIQNVIDKLRDLAASKFADKMGGSQVLTLSITSGDNHKIEKLVVNKAADEYEAQREGEPAVYIIDSAAFDDLQKQISGIKAAAKPAAKK
jgi:hypothetical protein